MRDMCPDPRSGMTSDGAWRIVSPIQETEPEELMYLIYDPGGSIRSGEPVLYIRSLFLYKNRYIRRVVRILRVKAMGVYTIITIQGEISGET